MGLDEWKTLADILGTVTTTVAVVVGGGWAYFKLIKGRTFRPHVEVGVTTEWLGREGEHWVKVSVLLKNIGAAKVELLQQGTGIRVRRVSGDQEEPPAEAVWEDVGGVHEVFLHHGWIEPAETIVDDLLLLLPHPVQVLEVQTRIVLAWKPSNVVVHSRRICIPREDATEAAPRGPANQPDPKPRVLGGEL